MFSVAGLYVVVNRVYHECFNLGELDLGGLRLKEVPLSLWGEGGLSL
jgi:hypothetical protein